MTYPDTQELRPHTVKEFLGLSNRGPSNSRPRSHCQDLINAELGDRTFKRRNGFTRKHTNQLRDASAYFNGVDMYGKIAYITDYNLGSDRFMISIDVVLRRFPTAAVTIWSRGFGAVGDLWGKLEYDPTVNSNNGGWVCSIRDADSGNTRTATVNDGGGSVGKDPIDRYRHIELVWSGSGDVYDLEVRNSAGAEIGTDDSLTVVLFNSGVTDPFIIGAGSTDGVTANTAFTEASFAEFRIASKTDAVPSAAGIVDRELSDAAGSDEYDDLDGYWQMNDGTGATFDDLSTNANDAVIGGEGATWETDTDLIAGSSGLRFWGEQGYVYIEHAAGANSPVTKLFTTSIAQYAIRAWNISFIYVPLMDSNDAAAPAAVRDQILFWCGESNSNAKPVGCEVDTDVIKVTYNDKNGTGYTVSSTTKLNTQAGNRARVQIGFGQDGSGDDRIRLQVTFEDGTVDDATTTLSTADSGDPTSVSRHWFLGRAVTNVAHPQVPLGSAMYGVIDDFYVYGAVGLSGVSNEPMWGQHPNLAALFEERGVYSPNPALGGPQGETLFYLKLNDGGGTTLDVLGSATDSRAFLYPMVESGVRWDQGIVTPHTAPEITLLADYRRLDKDGATIRSTIAISGCTLYELVGTEAVPRAANLHKGGLWSADLYEDSVYMVAPNGQPARLWDGTPGGVRWAGIEAPQVVSDVTEKTSGGALQDGDYFVYVTYRNSGTQDESNPGPSTAFTISGGSGNGAIDVITLPVSADPQVNQRRVWLSAVNGSATEDAFIVETINDNVTVTWSADIAPTSTYTAGLAMTRYKNLQAPSGGALKVWRDRLWIGANPKNPTLSWFSEPGNPRRFAPANFLETTKDSGDPVTAFEKSLGALHVHLRDGRKAIQEKGIAADPFTIFDLDEDQSAVGPNAVVEHNGSQYFMGEEDVMRTQGQGDTSISSPDDDQLPSVEVTLRDYTDRTRRNRTSMAIHRKRRQIWISYSSDEASGRNDRVLVYGLDRKYWSLYKMELDIVREIENAQDDSGLYAGSNGYIVKLDTGEVDGPDVSLSKSALSGNPTSGTATAFTDSAAGWNTDALKGLTVWIYDDSGSVAVPRRIASNTSDTIQLQTTFGATITTDDTYWIGGSQFYGDWVVDFGTVLDMKRLGWLDIGGKSNSSSTTIVAQILASDMRDSPNWANAYTEEGTLVQTTVKEQLHIGGVGLMFRVRLFDSDLVGENPSTPTPAFNGPIEIHEWRLWATRLAERL